MTKLLREAFSMASEIYDTQQDQDRLAYLMIENMDRLCEILEEEADERNFDACVIEAVNSEKIQKCTITEQNGQIKIDCDKK